MTSDRIPVLCLPHAGAGSSFFFPWRRLDPPGVTLVPLQLPGREERVEEELLTDVHAAVRALLPEAVAAVGDSRRVALFGHSLGAALAYELARALQEQTELVVDHLVVSGSPGPWSGRTEQAAALDDEEFLARIEEFAGYRHSAFDFPELRDMLLPILRADVAMHESYRPTTDAPTTTPITCVRGEGDLLVSRRDAELWRSATRGPFTYTELPGGHMYLAESATDLVDLIAGTVSAATAGGAR
ncbi:oleoyl-ACP hydrolase [Longispora fulva]|uniref:Surfactin synthase thioesterase subunit n=1 Tax=Longispora fulva TaxID=619741 RepID=A0A8J7G6V9_9ACTN|nr:alpha/beta fold hydrolase [Longispora fulva]MBG6134030.1 surfactin synthase thioesterase subunit [Longispora fulva]GIG63548.1 oleoyl-ACP hydrolase [Longispora fulva]